MNPPLTRQNASARRLALLTALAAIASLWPVQSQAEDLGRLFFTPERRQALDRQRQLNIQDKQEIPVAPTLTINGVVSRSSGKRTAFVNGVPIDENQMKDGLAVSNTRKAPGKVTVRPLDAPVAQAKVGDTINRNTGEATDLLGEGSITIKTSGTAKPAAGK